MPFLGKQRAGLYWPFLQVRPFVTSEFLQCMLEYCLSPVLHCFNFVHSSCIGSRQALELTAHEVHGLLYFPFITDSSERSPPRVTQGTLLIPCLASLFFLSLSKVWDIFCSQVRNNEIFCCLCKSV